MGAKHNLVQFCVYYTETTVYPRYMFIYRMLCRIMCGLYFPDDIHTVQKITLIMLNMLLGMNSIRAFYIISLYQDCIKIEDHELRHRLNYTEVYWEINKSLDVREIGHYMLR